MNSYSPGQSSSQTESSRKDIRVIVPSIAVGDFSSGTDDEVGRDRQEFTDEKVGVEHGQRLAREQASLRNVTCL